MGSPLQAQNTEEILKKRFKVILKDLSTIDNAILIIDEHSQQLLALSNPLSGVMDVSEFTSNQFLATVPSNSLALPPLGEHRTVFDQDRAIGQRDFKK